MRNLPSKNKLYVIFVFAFLAFAIYGLYVNFISYLETTNYILLFSVLLGAGVITPAFILDLEGVKIKTYQPVNKFFGFLFLLLLSTCFSWSIIKYSLPLIYTEIFGKAYVTHDFIKEKHEARIKSRVCKPYIRINRNNEILCVSKNFISKIKINDKLVLSGKKTGVGFRVHNIEINTVEKSLEPTNESDG